MCKSDERKITCIFLVFYFSAFVRFALSQFGLIELDNDDDDAQCVYVCVAAGASHNIHIYCGFQLKNFISYAWLKLKAA